jgi:UDP-glucuronate decarboxylase
MTKTLISGGAGMIGSHLCKRLLWHHPHDEVICLDSFFTGRKDNIVQLMHDYPARFEVIRHDVCEPITLDVDQIFNLACPASPPHYQHNPVHTTKTSVLGAINVLGIARRTGAKVFQASTSEVYGDPDAAHHPQSEEYHGNVNPIGIRSCYDEGKRVAETLFFDYHRQHNVRIKIARIFNTFGPAMNPSDGRVVSNFICQALKDEDITLYGDGSQTRSFCYVSDLIEGFVKLMNSDDTITGPINLGNPSEITVKQLAETIIKLTLSKSKLVYRTLPSDDPLQRKPDITKAKELLGWEPKVSLKDGLISTISYFRKELRNV